MRAREINIIWSFEILYVRKFRGCTWLDHIKNLGYWDTADNPSSTKIRWMNTDKIRINLNGMTDEMIPKLILYF